MPAVKVTVAIKMTTNVIVFLAFCSPSLWRLYWCLQFLWCWLIQFGFTWSSGNTFDDLIELFLGTLLRSDRTLLCAWGIDLGIQCSWLLRLLSVSSATSNSLIDLSLRSLVGNDRTLLCTCGGDSGIQLSPLVRLLSLSSAASGWISLEWLDSMISWSVNLSPSRMWSSVVVGSLLLFRFCCRCRWWFELFGNFGLIFVGLIFKDCSTGVSFSVPLSAPFLSNATLMYWRMVPISWAVRRIQKNIKSCKFSLGLAD